MCLRNPVFVQKSDSNNSNIYLNNINQNKSQEDSINWLNSFNEIFKLKSINEEDTIIINIDNESKSINEKNIFISEIPKSKKEIIIELFGGKGNIDKHLSIFKTKIYTSEETKIKKSRKFKSDDIRRKLKAQFHKSIYKIINEKLKKMSFKKKFNSLSRNFILDVSREMNKRYMEFTYEEILKINFNDENNKIKYDINQDVLNHLKKSNKIEGSEIEILLNTRYCDLLDYYFNSILFEKNLQIVKEKMRKGIEKQNESFYKGLYHEYINKYIKLAQNYVDYFIN